MTRALEALKTFEEYFRLLGYDPLPDGRFKEAIDTIRQALQPPDVDRAGMLVDFKPPRCTIHNVNNAGQETVLGSTRWFCPVCLEESLTRSAVDVEALKHTIYQLNEPLPSHAVMTHFEDLGFNRAIDVLKKCGLLGQGREGYVSVPIEPTEKMIDAGTEHRCLDCDTKLSGYNAVTAYKAMIRAAQPQGDSLAQIEKIRGR